MELNEQQKFLLKEILNEYIENSEITGGFDKTTTIIINQIINKLENYGK